MHSEDLLNLLANDGVNLDVETVIDFMFMEYKRKCNERSIYDIIDFFPQNLIKLYYTNGTKYSDFGNIVGNFKEKYIIQESMVEGVHNPSEIAGLGVVYDYIRSDEWKKCPNIYLILIIHMKLFSLTPYPEFGGKFRNSDCILRNSNIDVVSYNYIDREISSLYNQFDNLLADGVRLGEDKSLDNEDFLIKYISDCLLLKAKLIKIHPFSDGNGRTTRALVNLLFKIANLPPIYVKLIEKRQYLYAMNKAIACKEFDYLNRFYYYKICDSIMELDINDRIKNNKLVKKLKIK